VLRAASIGGDERQVDFGFERGGELDFGLFGGFLEALPGHVVVHQVDAVLFFELGNDPFHDAVVDVVAAEMGVAIGGLHFDDTVADFEDRDVEGAAAEVEHGDGFVLLFIEPVGERRRRGFVDDAHHFEAGDLAGVFGGLPLGVVEVGRDGDDRLADLFAEVGFGGFLQLREDHRRDFGRRELFALRLDTGISVVARGDFIGNEFLFGVDFVEPAPHEAFDGVDGVFGIGDRLPLGHLAHQALAALGEADDGRGGTRTFLIRDNDRRARFHYGNDGVGCSQVNSNDSAHDKNFCLLL